MDARRIICCENNALGGKAARVRLFMHIRTGGSGEALLGLVDVGPGSSHTRSPGASRSHGSRNPQELKFLRNALGKADRQALFDALFAVVLDESNPIKAFERQQLAGRLLLILQPPCPHPVKNVIRLLVTTWNVSVEEVPWYLAKTFGRDAVLAAVSELFLEPLDEIQRKKVDTVKYWVAAYTGEVRRYY